MPLPKRFILLIYALIEDVFNHYKIQRLMQRTIRFVILSMQKILMQGTAQRPEVRIVTWKNEELTTDALPVHGYEHYKAKDYVLAHAPFTGFQHLMSLIK